eukprot:7383037-Prymnesium_polylepis.1
MWLFRPCSTPAVHEVARVVQSPSTLSATAESVVSESAPCNGSEQSGGSTGYERRTRSSRSTPTKKQRFMRVNSQPEDVEGGHDEHIVEGGHDEAGELRADRVPKE